MKKFLFTLAALLMAGSVCAEEYMFMDDFEVPDSIMQQTSNKKRSMVVPIHAQFDRYVSSWQMWLQCPEGVTVYAVTTGTDYPLTYNDATDNEITFTPGFSWNDENQTGIAAVLLEQGYYYPEGTDPEEDDPVTYGNPKWLGAYDNYLQVTLRFAADFTGGELMVITEPASTDDPRGEICPKNQHFEKPCMITVEGGEEPLPTPAPEIVVTAGDDAYIFEAVGEGEITLYCDGQPVENPYTVVRTNEDQIIRLTATAHVEGQIDGTVTGEYLVPALEVVEPGDLTGEIVIGEPDEDGNVTIEYTGDEDVTIVVTVNGEDVEVVDGVITVGEGESVIVVTVTAEGYNDLTDTKTVTYTVNPPVLEDLTGEIVIGEPDEDGNVTVEYTGDEDVTIVVTVNGEPVEVVDGVITVGEGESEIVVTVTAEGYNDLTGEKTVTYTVPEPPVQTEMPEISYEVTDDAVIITATGEGEVLLYVNGELVDNPCTIERGATDVVVTVTATAQAEGEEISEVATMDITIPAIGEEPIDPHMVGKWIVLIEQDGTERWVPMNEDPNGENNWSVMMTLHHWPWNDEVPFYFMVDGVRYGSETDMQLPAMGDADQTILNPVFEGNNMFYVPSTYTYTFGLQFKDGQIWLLVAQGPQTAINEMNAGKNIAGVRYFNMAGQEMQEANGMTIVVTTYTDGTTSAVKVMK